MKKILLSLIAVMATLSINAQVVKVYENNVLSATYVNSSTNIVKVVAEEAPAGPEYVTITSEDGTETMKWATKNLGATTVADSPETSFGDYYAWGATETWYSNVSWSGTTPTFTWKDGYTDGYTSSHQPTVAGNTLSATEDIATITYPGWRMPTQAEFEWLATACGGSDTPTKITTSDAIPTTQGIYFIDARDATYKVAGMLFIDSKGASVFFPAAGCYNDYFDFGGSEGFYWSSSLYTNVPSVACILYVNSPLLYSTERERYSGLTVRPVSGTDEQVAQIVKVYENGTLSATYGNSSTNKVKVVFKENYPDESRGTAAVSGSAGIEDNNVKWVQLWENGPKWAVFNVGAKSVSEYGGYYNWGVSEVQNYENSDRYCDKTNDIQGTSDDTAKNLWGDNWQMPTETDYENLIANCTVEWTTQNGLPGRLYTGKGEYSSNSVFFPAAGYSFYGSVSDQGSNGCYWSSMPSYTSTLACRLYFNLDSHNMTNYYRYGGQSVRAVLNEEVPDPNLIQGKFSVSDTKQVQFTKGNLYYSTTDSKYHLESAQNVTYATLGQTAYDATHVCHFYWSNTNDWQTSGMEPWAETFGRSAETTGDKLFCGEDNKMTVDDTEGLYALSSDEWAYLVGDNTARSGKYACGVSVTTSAGTVENCVVIAPDACIGSYTFDNTKTSYTAEEWITAEAAGLVCLPAGGLRHENLIGTGGDYGMYWSATSLATDQYAVWYMGFDSSSVQTTHTERGYYANSVRLVKTVSE